MQNVFQRISNIRVFQNIRHPTEGSIWFLFHFHAVWTVSNISLCVMFHFYLMCSHMYWNNSKEHAQIITWQQIN